MLDRIQLGIADRDRLLTSQRMFVANAAHELRTPLTTIRTAIDVTLDGHPTADEPLAMAVDVRDAVEHIQRTLDGLLALARSHAGIRRREPVDLADVTAAALERSASAAADGEVEVHADLPSAQIYGGPTLLDRMVGNVIDNAIRYNHRGGHITVSTSEVVAHVELRVGNTGEPIPQDQACRLVEPFVRGTNGALAALRPQPGAAYPGELGQQRPPLTR